MWPSSTGISYSLVKFLDIRGPNSPFGRTRVNLNCDHTRALVSHLPMPYTNTIKQKSPQVYPLSTPVKGVDGEVRLFPSGSGFQRNGDPESRNPTKTKVVTLHRCKIVVRCLNGQDPTTACGQLQPGSVTRSIVKFLDFRGRNSPFRGTRGNLVTTRASFLVFHLPMPYPNIIKQKSPQATLFRRRSKG